jgi:hypothetical protein
MCFILLVIPLERYVADELHTMLIVTLSAYGVLRGLNSVISMAQGTELSIEPMGVGMTLTPGELLDPLNDLVEQVSTVLLISSASIGIQRILTTLFDEPIIRLLFGLAVISISLFAMSAKQSKVTRIRLTRFILILTLFRLMIPITIMTSSLMQAWLSPEREEALTVLVETESHVKRVTEISTQQSQSNWLTMMKEKLDISDTLEDIKRKAESAVMAGITILTEFIFVFIVLPIFCMIASYKLISMSFKIGK